jgi:hypothetical protein
MKNNFSNLSFVISFLILICILAIRIKAGLDLTDEMQFYSQIEGLVKTGNLFSNDLFIQQTGYILFYPFFYIYHLIFDFNGLVFFGRLLMAVLSLFIFFYSYEKLLHFKFTRTTSALAALSLTFSIPYHGIFALSYNTISQFLWIIFLVNFYQWGNGKPALCSWITVIMIIVYPTSALVMSLLLLARLIVERKRKEIIQFFLVFFFGLLFTASLLLYFSSPHSLLNSFNFSSGYGLGLNFFLDKWQPGLLLSYFALFFMLALLNRYFFRQGKASLFFCLWVIIIVFNLHPKYSLMMIFLILFFIFFECTKKRLNHQLSNFKIPSFLCSPFLKDFFFISHFWWLMNFFLVIAIYLFLEDKNQYQGGYSIKVFSILSGLFIFSFGWALSNNSLFGKKNESRLLWLGISILIFASSLAITSGNALGQSSGAFMIGLPLMLGEAVSLNENNNTRFLASISMVFLVVLFIVHWSIYPYRDEFWWKQKYRIDSVREFNLINTYSKRLEFIDDVKKSLSFNLSGKVLIASGFPAFYIISNAEPETCMLFMHDLGNNKSHDLLVRCLKEKNPETIFDFNYNGGSTPNFIKDIYKERPFDCSIKSIKTNEDIRSHPKDIYYQVCKKSF